MRPLALVSLLACARLASAETIAIEHDGVACVVAGKLPRIDARLAPADRVARARTYFRADDDPHWYYVDMKAEGGEFRGVLPQPLPTTQRLHYYVEATHRDVTQNRTQEYAPVVVPDATACGSQGKVAVVAAASKVVVGAPAGASATPAGFAANTVAAVGGGIGATALVVAGVAAAGGAAVAVKGGGEAGDSGPNSGSNFPPIVVEGTVYTDTCCPAGIVDPNNRANSRRIQGALVSSSLDSATATSNAQGVFRLDTQTRCSAQNSTMGGPSFTLTIAAPGCDTLNVTRTWGCASSGPNIYALNLACR